MSRNYEQFQCLWVVLRANRYSIFCHWNHWVSTKPRRFGDVCGGARSRQEKSSICYSPGWGWQGKCWKFSWRGAQVSSLTQMFAWVDNKVNRPGIAQKNILTVRENSLAPWLLSFCHRHYLQIIECAYSHDLQNPSALYYKTHHDCKNYDRISGEANYDPSVINFDVSVVNYDSKVLQDLRC